MAGFPRIIRGMLGTGVAFAVGVGALATVTGLVVTMFGNGSLIGTLRFAGRLSVASFLLGLIFSAILATISRRRRLGEISIMKFAALGAGAGLVYFGAIALNAYRVWSVGDAVRNLLVLTVLGAGSAAGTLAFARWGRAELSATEERPVIGDR
jgi:hypothetical protein